MNLDRFAFSKTPGFDEAKTRKEFAEAVPLQTVVVNCYDPRAAGAPLAVARWLGQEPFPGEILRDSVGAKVASTTQVFPVIVAGGRAVDALRSISVAQHLFGIENVVIVHHSNCGATSFTADGIVAAYRREHEVDISSLYDRKSLSISGYEASLEHDVALVRQSSGTARHIDVFGLFFDIDTESLTEVVRAPGRR